MLETLLELLEQGYFEIGLVFEGLADEHVWKRPDEKLLSIGEMAGHVAYWEAVRLAGDGGQSERDVSSCKVSSLLVEARFRYYPITFEYPPTEEHKAMTAQQVRDELMRVHNEAVAYFKSINPDLSSAAPGWPPDSTYGDYLKYLVFHVAYHTGQMYSVRHLLGEQTPDN